MLMELDAVIVVEPNHGRCVVRQNFVIIDHEAALPALSLATGVHEPSKLSALLIWRRFSSPSTLVTVNVMR